MLQKSGRLVLWEAMFILELHSAETQDCDEHGVRVTYCTSCGNELGREGFGGTEHEWTTGTYEAWDEDTHTVVEKERTYCSRCGVSQ